MDGEGWSLCRSILVGHDHDAVPFSLLRLRLCHERRDMMGMKESEGGGEMQLIDHRKRSRFRNRRHTRSCASKGCFLFVRLGGVA